MTRVSVSHLRQHLPSTLKRVQQGKANQITSRGRVIARLQPPDRVAPAFSFKQLLAALRLVVLPITPEIALLSRSSLVEHGDAADRWIGATALQLRTPLITQDAKLRALESLETVG